MRRSLALLALLALSTPAAAHAASDEVVLSIEPGYDRVSRTVDSQNGVGGNLTAWIGLTDSLWLLASGGGFYMFENGENRSSFLRWEAFGGIVAALDVFRVVPSLELGVGVVGGRDNEVFPTIRAGAAVDYLFTPEWSMGVTLRYRPLPEDDIGTSAISAQLRMSYRFAW